MGKVPEVHGMDGCRFPASMKPELRFLKLSAMKGLIILMTDERGGFFMLDNKREATLDCSRIPIRTIGIRGNCAF